MNFLSKRLSSLHPYVPGEQPTDRDYIKLNANENPYPPHESVGQAVKTAVEQNRAKLGLYPDPDVTELRQAIADMLNDTGGVLCRAATDNLTCIPAAEDALLFCRNTPTAFTLYTAATTASP